MHHGQHIEQHIVAGAGTTERKQFRQIVRGVRKYQNRITVSINGGRLPKFGNALPSDHLVINTASALRSERSC
jgi:hypothetical protein